MCLPACLQAPWEPVASRTDPESGLPQAAQTVGLQMADSDAAIEEHSQGVSISTRSPKYAPKPRTLGKVVLVGGGTRSLAVRSFVKDLTGLDGLQDIDPEAVVSFGCAMYAGMLMGQVEGCEMTDGSFVADAHSRVTGF